MNITRDVVNDLLPLYFSGEASAETRRLVEEFFRQDPEFERMARSSAIPLDALRGAPLVAPEAEREKRDLESVRCELSRRKWWFGMALFFTVAPLSFIFDNGRFVWLMVRDNPWDAAVYWSLAAFFWMLYLARMRRREVLLSGAIFVSLFTLVMGTHYITANWPRVGDNLPEIVIAAIGAVLCWWGYISARKRT